MVILNLDASLLKLSGCDTRFFFVATGNRPKIVSPPLRIGSIFHRYAELRSKGTDKLDCIRRLVTAENLAYLPQEKFIETFAAFEGSQLGRLSFLKDGTPAAEVKYRRRFITTPTAAVDLYANIDRINFDGSWVDIVDYKSTARVESAWWKFADLERENFDGVQLSLYLWLLWNFGAEILPLETYNAIREGRFAARVCGILYNAKPFATWKMGGRFTMTPDDLNSLFAERLTTIAYRLLATYESQIHEESGRVLNLCPGCNFQRVCRAPGEVERSMALIEYEKVPYDPHNFGTDV